MAADSCSILSHPEILSVEKLKNILSSRGIPSKDLVDKSKDDLVQLFYHFIVPLPQRTTHMRRANRRKQNVAGVSIGSTITNKGEFSSRGIKRKYIPSNIAETSKTKEVSNFLHDNHQPSSSSPTTECANKIRKFTMNCQMSKPLKLKREHLLHNYKPCNTSMAKSKILSSTRQTTSETSKEDCLQISTKNNTKTMKEENTQNTRKKFKRITVTWP